MKGHGGSFLMKDREFSLMVGTLSGLLLMIPSKPERDPDHPSLIHTLPLSLLEQRSES